jgi:hypothetical protein
MSDYGVVTTNVGLLTLDEYRKYRVFIRQPPIGTGCYSVEYSLSGAASPPARQYVGGCVLQRRL